MNVRILESDVPAGARGRPAEQIEERSFAGAVGADHAEYLGRKDLDIDAVHGNEAAEASRELAGLEQAFVLPWRRCIGACLPGLPTSIGNGDCGCVVNCRAHADGGPTYV